MSKVNKHYGKIYTGAFNNGRDAEQRTLNSAKFENANVATATVFATIHLYPLRSY